MRALVIRSARDFVLDSVRETILDVDDIPVAPILAGACGTDLELIVRPCEITQ